MIDNSIWFLVANSNSSFYSDWSLSQSLSHVTLQPANSQLEVLRPCSSNESPWALIKLTVCVERDGEVGVGQERERETERESSHLQ